MDHRKGQAVSLALIGSRARPALESEMALTNGDLAGGVNTVVGRTCRPGEIRRTGTRQSRGYLTCRWDTNGCHTSVRCGVVRLGAGAGVGANLRRPLYFYANRRITIPRTSASQSSPNRAGGTNTYEPRRAMKLVENVATVR
jgi:hypothetical protein